MSGVILGGLGVCCVRTAQVELKSGRVLAPALRRTRPSPCDSSGATARRYVPGANRPSRAVRT